MKSLLLIPLCLALVTSAQKGGFEIKILDSSRYTIIQKDSLSPVYLSVEEIIKTEKILEQALKDNKFSSKTDFKRYRFQLVPSLNVKGEKEIWMNCFCYHSDWQREWQAKIFPRDLVADGGQCFFDLKINLSLNNYSGFGMNGYG